MKNSQFFNKVSEILSICIFLAGSTVLIGWIFDVPVLKSISPDFVAMKANTAICFILIGLSLWLSQTKRQGNRTARKIARLCACVVFLIGFLSFCEYLFKWDFGIDQLLFKESATAILTSSPGRMAFNTSIIFVITGIVLLLYGFEIAVFSYLAQVLVIPAVILTLLSFVGYLYGASPLYIGLKFSTAMALHTSVLFIMSCIGCLFARPRQGLMKNVSSDSFGGQMLRRILPAIIFVPLVLGGIEICGEHTKWFGNEFGVSLVATCNLLILSLFIYIFSAHLNRLDIKRKAAETVLRDSEARYKSLFSTAVEGILVADVQKKKHIYCNPAICRMLGYTEEELMHLDVGVIHPKEALGCAMAEFEALARGEKKFTELPCQRKDGTVFDASIGASGVIIDGRECLFGVFTDNTERKEAEESLIRAAREWTETFDAMSDGVSIHNSDFTILNVNKSLARLLNRQKEDIIGQACYTIFHNQNNPIEGCPLERCKTTQKEECAEVFEPSLGKWLAVSTSPVLDERGNIQKIIHSVRDITQRKRAEEALRRSEAFKHTILDSIKANIAVLDSSGTLIAVNEPWRQFARANGLADQQGAAEGINYLDVLRQAIIAGVDNALEILDGIEKVLAGSLETFSAEYSCHSPTEQRWFLMTVTRLDGSDDGVVISHVNTTDRKKAEEILQLHQAHMAHLLRLGEVGEMASGMAHEINQPLCAIENYAQACLRLTESGTDTTRMVEVIKDIRGQAERAGKIIQRIRGLVRKKTPVFEYVRIRDIIQEAVDLVGAEAQKRGIPLAVDIPENLSPVYADYILIEQVIINLIRNGLEAMDSPQNRKKELTIRALSASNNTVEVCVLDTGCGIPQANSDRIFESFFTTKTDGLGIGLPLSRAIIESHSGKIWATPNAAGGMTFHFTLSTGSCADET